MIVLGEGDENPRWTSNRLMASTKVIYRGHPVAAVAAADRYVAEEAAKKVKVEYEILPVHNDVDSALADQESAAQCCAKGEQSRITRQHPVFARRTATIA